MLIFARDYFYPDGTVKDIVDGNQKTSYSEHDYFKGKTLDLAVNEQAKQLIQSYDALGDVVEGFAQKTREIFGNQYLGKYMLWEVLEKMKLLADGGIMIRVSGAFFSPWPVTLSLSNINRFPRGKRLTGIKHGSIVGTLTRTEGLFNKASPSQRTCKR